MTVDGLLLSRESNGGTGSTTAYVAHQHVHSTGKRSCTQPVSQDASQIPRRGLGQKSGHIAGQGRREVPSPGMFGQQVLVDLLRDGLGLHRVWWRNFEERATRHQCGVHAAMIIASTDPTQGAEIHWRVRAAAVPAKAAGHLWAVWARRARRFECRSAADRVCRQPTHRSRRRISRRATGLPRNLTFAEASEQIRVGDSSRSRAPANARHRFAAERPHPKVSN